MRIEAIKQLVPIEAVLRKYIGWNGVRSMPCPIHNGKHKNFSIHRGRFRCFKCGASGDCIDFVSIYFNVGIREAANMIEHDFGLSDVRVDKEQLQRQIRKREQQQKEELHVKWSLDVLSEYLRYLSKHEKPTSLDETCYQLRFIEFCQMEAICSHMWNEIFNTNSDCEYKDAIQKIADGTISKKYGGDFKYEH